MLVLKRKNMQSIVIGPSSEPVEITVTHIEGNGQHGSVRLSIDAPPDVEVHRREIWDAIHPEPPKPER